MKKLLLGLLVLSLLFGFNAFAADAEITWTSPTKYCDESDLDSRTWFTTQIVYHTESMSMPSDTNGPCSSQKDPVPAEPVPLITLKEYVNSYTLTINEPTYVRVRVCHCKNWLADFSCFYDVTAPFQNPDGTWSGGEYVYLTWEALDELTGNNYRLVDEHLNCSAWKTEELINVDGTIVPNSPTELKVMN